MTTDVGRVLQQLRDRLQKEGTAALRDAELLDRFQQTHAEHAFAALVERHGPMILGVCRRVLQNPHDADDAFQATFLVLARQASRLRRPDSLAAWLYGIALRLALNMKRDASKRRQREKRATSPSAAPPPDPCCRELHTALDEELARLPDRNRQPLLLCYFEGLTQEEAAHQLGWRRGTLKRRLERGRDLLKARLTKRGLTLGAALLATLPAGEALAVPLPTPLASATVHAATVVALGQTAGNLVSAKAIALAEGVLKAMVLAKLGKLTAVLVVAIVCCGLGLMSYSRSAASPTPAANQVGRADDNNPPKSDGELIQGTWTVVKTGHGGKMLPREAKTADEQIWIISEGKISIRYSDGATKEITYRLDPKVNPKAVDVTIGDEGGGRYLGIYALDGDTLQFAYSRNSAPTAERYKGFFRDDHLEDRGRRYFLLKRQKPGESARPRSKEEAANLRKQFEANADQFDFYLGRHGYGSSKIDLRSIALHSSNRRFEPSAIGPSGKPIFKSARITKDQALKIMGVLDGFPAQVFRTARFGNRPLDAKEPFLSTRIGYGPDARPGPQLQLAQDWGWHTLGELHGIAECVDGEAAKIVRELIDAIRSEPDKKPADAQPGKQAGNAAKRYAALAQDLPIFQTHDFAMGRVGRPDFATRIMPKKLSERWLAITRTISAGKDDVGELIALLKHNDPKVRTLALAALFDRQDPKLLPHLAALVSDNAKTAPAVVILRANSSLGKDNELLPQDLQEQTVGQVASAFLMRWLGPAGYKLEEFQAYWADRKERTWCANWFLSRFQRAGQSTTAFDKERGTPLIRGIRKEIDALPEIDRDWTLLWVATHHGAMSDEPARILATPGDLIAAGKRLGPRRLMDLIEEREISKDPDLATGQPAEPRRTRGRDDMILWVLKHAGRLLRPEDAPTLLALEKELRDQTPWCAIAAAELKPAKASEWLHSAMVRFAGKPLYTYLADHRADIAAGLWRIVGESELDYLADWFFDEKVDKNPHSPQTGRFLEAIEGVRSPGDRKLVVRLVSDPRLDKLDYQSLRAMIQIVNHWTTKPLVAGRDLYPGWETGTWGPETPADLKVLAGWRSKLRDSVKEWSVK